MSRAFVKEPKGDQAELDLPKRPISLHPNYVTPRGYDLLQTTLAGLQAEGGYLRDEDNLSAKLRLKEVERDIRYYEARVATAKLVLPDPESRQVRIGSTVEVLDEDAKMHKYTIVGEDEADAAVGLVSWISPLGQSLLGGQVGEVFTWARPSGSIELEIMSIKVR